MKDSLRFAKGAQGRENVISDHGGNLGAPVEHISTPEPVWPVKRYVERKMVCHIHIRASIGDSNAAKLCVRFEAIADKFVVKPWKASMGSGGQGDDWRTPVLVDIRQFSEDEERVPLCTIPSVVRLQPLDSCLCVSWQWIDRFAAEVTRERTGRLAQGEEEGALVVGGEGLIGVNGHRVDEVVQGGPEVVEAVAEDKPETRRDLRDIANRVFDEMPTMFGFRGDRWISIRFSERSQLFIEQLEVMLRPFEPGADSVEAHGSSEIDTWF